MSSLGTRAATIPEGERNELIAKKAVAAHAASLKPIVCVGRNAGRTRIGRTEKVVGAQLQGSLAGLSKAQMERRLSRMSRVGDRTGKTATPAQRRRCCFYSRRVEKLFNETVARRRADSVWRQREAVECAQLMGKPDVRRALVAGLHWKFVRFLIISKTRFDVDRRRRRF